MIYSFSENKYVDLKSGVEKTCPTMHIESQEKYGCFFLDEILNLSSNLDYVKEIVNKLELLLQGHIIIGATGGEYLIYYYIDYWK